MRKNGAGKNNWGNFKDDLKDYGVDEDEYIEEPQGERSFPS